jgi:hypothetical protein
MSLVSISCVEQNPAKTVEQTTVSERYYYQGKIYEIKADSIGEFVQDADYHFLSTAFEDTNVGIAVTEYDNINYVYTNEEEFEEVLQLLREQYPKAENGNSEIAASDRKGTYVYTGQTEPLAKSKSTTGVYLYEDSNQGGQCEFIEYTGWLKLLCSSLGTFNDKMSSIYVSPGVMSFMKVWEDANYSGRSITFWANSSALYISNLKDYCRKRCLWWCCGTWNDVISSFKINES